MKRLLILAFFSIFFVSLSAQDSYLGFRMGSSITRGDFAARENMFSNGFALSGFTIKFDGVYFPVRVVGIGGVIDFGSYYSERDNYLNQLIDFTYNESTLPLDSYVPGISEVDFEAGYWNYINLMVGPELSVAVSRFQLGVRAFGGFALVSSPEKDLLYTTPLSNELSASVHGLNIAPSYSFGASLIYKTRSGTGFKVSTDYFSTRSKYDVDLKLSTLEQEFEDTRPGRVNVENLDITVGIFYMF